MLALEWRGSPTVGQTHLGLIQQASGASMYTVAWQIFTWVPGEEEALKTAGTVRQRLGTGTRIDGVRISRKLPTFYEVHALTELPGVAKEAVLTEFYELLQQLGEDWQIVETLADGAADLDAIVTQRSEQIHVPDVVWASASLFVGSRWS